MATAELAGLVKRLEVVTKRLESISVPGAAVVSSEFLDAYDADIVNGNLKTFLDLCDKLGGDVKNHGALFKTAFDVHREYLCLVAQAKHPKPDQVAKVNAPLQKAVEAVVDFFESHRRTTTPNHLQAIKEMIPCLGWVTISPKPAVHVKQAYDAAMFYTNRVLMEFKRKEDEVSKMQVSWTRAATGLLKDLQEYVKEYHTPGPSWNPEGVDPLSVTPSSTPASGGPPPPPPSGGAPPPPPPPAVVPPTETSDGGGVKAVQANLFAEINKKGGDITSGLKKVTNEMKTHKNPELRASSVVKAGDLPAKKQTKPVTTAPAVKKNPVFGLQGKKWIVEYQEDNPNLSITETNKSQTVYMYKCNKCTIKVDGKVNGIILDSCKRVAVVFESVISMCEFVNCQSVQAQVLGVIPAISIDKTDGCQVYLSKDSMNCVFVTAKSSEMNVLVPNGPDGDYTEHAIPEQFKTSWNGTNLQTECTDINA